MKKNYYIINRICFKKEEQLLNNAAINHSRILLLFSLISICLVIFSILLKKDTLQSIFGINLSSNSDIPIFTIVLVCILVIAYELFQFYSSCEKSKSSFSKEIDNEPQTFFFQSHYQTTIEYEKKINLFFEESLVNFNKNIFEKVIDKYKEQDSTLRGYIKKTSDNTSEILLLFKDIKEIIDNKENLNDEMRLEIQSKLYRLISFIEPISNAIPYLSQREDNKLSQSIHATYVSNMNRIFDTLLLESDMRKIINNQNNINENIKILTELVIKKSVIQKDYFLADIYLPYAVSILALIVSICYVSIKFHF
ncbi:hypothetical protein [Shewanella baltica]|uniref:hypothetical protein n=1 Tax=Shewanella baltica TaxID=62322 RepID=UPI00217EC097|nr:hypothetical protein [Shewanella baltica]MCS6178925.1 hypothetical protein [Shewanella baltica]MCS6255089.1 hypothetical protein [Shewanella baltica]